ncbi:MAG: hypothetical protein ACK4N5_14600, partial [Myxococcales bacterium]
MPAPAANANQQTAALQRLIARRSADGKVNRAEAMELVAQAKKENVQIGELALLRQLAGKGVLTEGARDAFVRSVDQVVPAGAPTAQLSAILFRIDPDTGRKQLLALLDGAKNPVPGGPKTFVVTGLGKPYLAGITTAQVISGLTKFLDGATPRQAEKLRHYLGQQLDALQKPVSRGGLAVPGRLPGPKGLAFASDTRAGPITAVNQNAVVLRALERIAQLEGAENAALARRARTLGTRVARELKSELDFTYPAKGRLAYSLTMRNGRASVVRLEDGNHLKTTLDALKALKVFAEPFAPVVARVERRLPEIAFAGPEDLSNAAGQIYTPA